MIEAATILSLIEFAIKEEPQVEASLRKVFSKPNPTPEDWQAERDAIAAESYRKLVPNTNLPPDTAA
jgi:hypothetical protein